MHHSNDLQKVKYSESLASIFGASFIAFSLGVWLNETFSAFTWPIAIAGVMLHSWGMYKTYQRNK